MATLSYYSHHTHDMFMHGEKIQVLFVQESYTSPSNPIQSHRISSPHHPTLSYYDMFMHGENIQVLLAIPSPSHPIPSHRHPTPPHTTLHRGMIMYGDKIQVLEFHPTPSHRHPTLPYYDIILHWDKIFRYSSSSPPLPSPLIATPHYPTMI